MQNRLTQMYEEMNDSNRALIRRLYQYVSMLHNLSEGESEETIAEALDLYNTKMSDSDMNYNMQIVNYLVAKLVLYCADSRGF